ncbi:hypothetical protein KSP40_PGU011305 [Platanthera guangdongensis]|uniref:Uncharacterized protein n=1 Tax=Platanthera guangdongensis TaxID=2320717 RepID=A0ABR2MI01_9ASPA
MGSEGPSMVTVHITGFKKFLGVAENPTETIVSNLKSYMEKKGLPKGLIIGSCSILETAGEGAVATLYKVLESALDDHADSSTTIGRVIWVSEGMIKASLCVHRANQWASLTGVEEENMENTTEAKVSGMRKSIEEEVMYDASKEVALKG